jgi:hypothetical protein
MTVKDYLKIHNGDDIYSIGIYKANVNENENSDIIDAHVKTVDIVKYEDLEIEYVHLFIYDEPDKDFQGSPIILKHIRACIYVK